MEDDPCCICLDDLNPTTLKLKCNHSFHNICIIDWLKRETTCPMCRQFINLNYPFIASESMFFRSKILIVVNDVTLTIFKNSVLMEIILFDKIKNIKLGRLSSINIKLNTSSKKIYFCNSQDTNVFYKVIKTKLSNNIDI